MLKMNRRILGWQSKKLSFRERYTLIADVLQSLPVYLLSTINLLKGVVNRLDNLMAKCFLGKTKGVKRKTLGDMRYNVPPHR